MEQYAHKYWPEIKMIWQTAQVLDIQDSGPLVDKQLKESVDRGLECHKGVHGGRGKQKGTRRRRALERKERGDG